jgi:transposase
LGVVRRLHQGRASGSGLHLRAGYDGRTCLSNNAAERALRGDAGYRSDRE